MATYTMDLTEVIARLYGPYDYTDYRQEYGDFEFNGVKYGHLPKFDDWTPLGLGHYPIFDESYRPILNGKIIQEYWNYEIGMETIDSWQLSMERTMNQVMPYINKLYESELIPYSALSTMDLLTEGESNVKSTEEASSNSSSTSSSDSDSKATQFQTPQTMLAGNEDYATSANKSESESVGTASADEQRDANSETDNTSKSRTSGFQGPASDLITRFRQTFLNLDVMVLSEIQSCFMLIRNDGSSYTRSDFWSLY